MNFNEFNELRVKGIEVIAKFVAENINRATVNPNGTLDLSGIQSQIDLLKDATTKAARIEAVQALQTALESNSLADSKLKQQVDALVASLGDVSATQLKASVDKLLADVAALQVDGSGSGVTSQQLQELQLQISSLKGVYESDISSLSSQLNLVISQLTEKADTFSISQQMQKLVTTQAFDTLQRQVDTLVNTRSKSKVVDVSSIETIDTFDGSNLITLVNNSGVNNNITKFTSGITGQKIDLRLYANTTIVHDNSFIRCKGNTNVVGTNANQFITFVCISGGGLSGSNGVWLEISRNF